ncbi:MAG: CaiB/BaiF CoA transferase family protein, partial [Woeseiaceae bacterium]
MDSATPLDKLRVVEFTHMIMGPACGMALAELGADVIKVEPPGGDKTRHLAGSGSGYFPMYNRNKRSICLDVKSDAGREAALRLIDSADVFIENFRPGTMERLGFGYEALAGRNPRLVYCSEKGFLTGPYEKRTALDEVAQMMSGLAYMTGPPGRPLRAGASVVDVQGALFGALGILAAIVERESTGRGKHVTASLFESAVFLVGQHMAQLAVT